MSHVVMTFGRFNPPTIGHQLLIDKMLGIKVPLDDKRFVSDIDRIVYISPTVGKNNPLDFQTRYDLVNKAFRNIDIIVSEIQHKDIFAAIKWVYELGYSDLHVVVGGDRFEELNKRIPQYNGDLYKFNSIRVHSAGDRDDSDSLAGMSASKMREAAKLGDYETFESGLPNKLRSMSYSIYQRVREACQKEHQTI